MKALLHALGVVLLLMGVAEAQPISTFPPASTPLSGSELLYLVQNGISKQITVGNFPPASGIYTLPPATASVLGGVKPDGTTLTNTAGALSVTYGTSGTTAAAGNDARIIGALAAHQSPFIPFSVTFPASVSGTGVGIFSSGSVAAPLTTPAANIVASLYTSYGPGAGQPNIQQGAFVGLSQLSGSATQRSANTRGGFFEAVDNSGNSGSPGASINFVEGSRSQGISLATNGAAYGSVSYAASAAGVPYIYAVGHESAVDQLSGTDAPTLESFNPLNFSTGYLATSGDTPAAKHSDAGFMTNPFSSAPPQTAFFAPSGSFATAAFGSNASALVGLDIGSGTWSLAPILLPNNTPIQMRVNSTTVAQGIGLNATPASGATSIAVQVNNGASTTFRSVLVGSADSGGTGFRALIVPN
jgi:hypothetical protein